MATQTTSKQIEQLYKARKTIISFLGNQTYNVEDYANFSIHEVNAMIQQGSSNSSSAEKHQLDMLVSKEDNTKKAYVKFHLGKTLRPQNIYEYIDDLFNLEEILTKKDDLIIIMKDEPNDTLLKMLQNIWAQDGIFINVFNINRLQYNILNHTLVPPHILLTKEEADEIKKKYYIKDDSQIPDISRFGPVAQAIGMRPGDMCHIIRPSKTSVQTSFYRICSA
jgi:DNA-directed RNA polymerases I, II, and III subunit RPABC1